MTKDSVPSWEWINLASVAGVLILKHWFFTKAFNEAKARGANMTKAFDLADLADRLKAKGLSVLEQEAKIIVEETLAWTEASVLLTDNKIDDLSIAGIEAIKPFVMGQLDKIDGK